MKVRSFSRKRLFYIIGLRRSSRLESKVIKQKKATDQSADYGLHF